MNICINLKYVVSLIFSSKYLTHRQQCKKSCDIKDDLMFNIEICGDKMLFSHIKAQFERKNVNK